MRAAFSYRIKGQQLWLSAERSIYWAEESALILSDLHFGKTGHFRKSGIAVPHSVYQEDLQRLVTQIQYFQPKKLIVVGDLFHSHQNKELELFHKWRMDFPHLAIHLIKGNHDILEKGWYEQAEIEIHDSECTIRDFQFIHDIAQLSSKGQGPSPYCFSGHIHPGVRINGLGKQSLSFPCFYFANQYAVLPAFSRFTGVAIIEPRQGESIFAIVENQVIQFQ